MFVFPPQFVYCNPHSSVMVLEDGAFERWLGHEGRVLMNGNRALRPQRTPSPLSPCEVTVKIQSSLNQESSPHQSPRRDLRLASLQNWEK